MDTAHRYVSNIGETGQADKGNIRGISDGTLKLNLDGHPGHLSLKARVDSWQSRKVDLIPVQGGPRLERLALRASLPHPTNPTQRHQLSP